MISTIPSWVFGTTRPTEISFQIQRRIGRILSSGVRIACQTQRNIFCNKQSVQSFSNMQLKCILEPYCLTGIERWNYGICGLVPWLTQQNVYSKGDSKSVIYLATETPFGTLLFFINNPRFNCHGYKGCWLKNRPTGQTSCMDQLRTYITTAPTKL